jgi:hypothetical protein
MQTKYLTLDFFSFLFLSLASLFTILTFVMAFVHVSVLDDAYMFIRYGYNLEKYGTYGWNAGEKTYGSTSILYTFFVWFGIKIGLYKFLGPQYFITFCSYFFGGIFVYFLIKVLKLFTFDDQYSKVFLRCTLAALLLNSSFSGSLRSGMDTTLSLSFNVCTVYCYLLYSKSKSGRLLLGAAFLSYLSYLARPDNALFALLFPALFFIFNKYSFKHLLVLYVVLVALFLLDAMVKYHYFGDILPLPYYVKSHDFLYAYFLAFTWHLGQYFNMFFMDYCVVFAIVSIGFVTKEDLFKGLPFFIVVILTIGYLCTKHQIMGGNARFFIPSAPYIWAGFLLMLKEKLNTNRFIFNYLSKSFLVLCMYFMVLKFFNLYMIKLDTKEKTNLMTLLKDDKKCPILYQDFLEAACGIESQIIPKFDSLLYLLPTNTTLAATEHGYLSAMHPDLKILDFCGLHDKQLALNGWSDAYFEEQKPDIIWIILDYPNTTLKLCSNKYYQENYIFYPKLYGYGISLRKNSPNFERIRQLFVH